MGFPPSLLLLGLLVIVVAASVKVIPQYQQGVVLTLGRYTGTRRPGLALVVPWIQELLRVDMRVSVTEVEPQDVISRDNVSVKVTAVVYAKVQDPRLALLEVANYRAAVSQLAQVMLRSTLGAHTLDELLQKQDELKRRLKELLDERTEAWGVEIQAVEIRSLDLEPNMIRAMAQEAEAERGRRARVITAEGEAQAAEKLAEAARTLSATPQAMVLRTLSTLKEIAAEKNSTIVFPMPLETMMPTLLDRIVGPAKEP
jgi:regulator of protease activity HflC (stomatin/prohibitin superfamily)